MTDYFLMDIIYVYSKEGDCLFLIVKKMFYETLKMRELGCAYASRSTE